MVGTSWINAVLIRDHLPKLKKIETILSKSAFGLWQVDSA